ncbi:MAG: OmpA family protein [Rhodocyclaceae bacterium]|nr:OmpA family protein [Rhodocyclaceae bacterium]
MNKHSFSPFAVERLLILLATLVALAACTGDKVVAPTYHDDLDGAIAALAGRIAEQLPGGLLSVGQGGKIVVVDAFFNEQSAEVTNSGVHVQKGLVERLAKANDKYEFAALSTRNLSKSSLAILGSVRLAGKAANNEKSYARIEAVVREVESGKVVANAVAFVASQQFDATPTRLYMDMPMFLAGDEHQQRLQVVAGNAAPVKDVVGVSARIAEATEQYNAGNFSESGRLFKEALDASGGKSLLALSGLYQSEFRGGDFLAAERTFGELVAAAIGSGKLSIKFLFEVNGTAFAATGDLTRQYPMWQRQIAKQIAEGSACLEVQGHASRSGTEAYNDKLSARRAEYVANSLRSIRPDLKGRLSSSGKGFSENIVGSGTDDAQDAIDRRVEFKILPCAQ